MSAPGFVFYPGDYFRDTRGLDTLEHGAYMLLILTLYAEGGRVAKSRLPRLTGLRPKAFETVWQEIGRFFFEDGDAIGHKRVDRELEKQRKLSETRADVARTRHSGARKTSKKPAKKCEKIEGKISRTPEKTEENQGHSSAIAEQMQVTLSIDRVSPSYEGEKPYLSPEGEDALARLLRAAASASSLHPAEIEALQADVTGFADGTLIIGNRRWLQRYSQKFRPALTATGLRLAAAEDPPGGNVVRLAKVG